jgi:nucleoside-diphosphate-sugar epimerase
LEILIIGGTRNLGHLLTLDLLKEDHRVTVFNRGQTPDMLPPEVQRLRGDRSDPSQLNKAIAGRSFDVVVDMALYNGADAQTITSLLDGHVGHYIFISTGQVYLVRADLQRPFTEAGYAGSTIKAPPEGTHDYEEWLYGIEKRQAEDILRNAWETRSFPFTSLRLPMVNSERDHFHRIHGYLLRLKDGGPILIPAEARPSLRHVCGHDVIKTIAILIQQGTGKGCAYNLSQDETLPLEEFLALLSNLACYELRIARVAGGLLESRKLLPDCSPFSGRWMSELDNRRSKEELGIQYTPLPVYLQMLIEHYESNPPCTPEGYCRRSEEIALAANT